MGKICCLLLIGFFLLTTSACAFDDLPLTIKSGFDQYAKEGSKAALAAWAKGSALEGSKEVLSQANNFQQIQDYYGKFIGFDVVKSVQHSSTSTVYLIEIKYEKGNVFSKFFTYRKGDGQVIITTYNFHTNAEVVWPAALVFGGCDNK